MSKKIITTVDNCEECPFVDHTGAFTPGGAKPCCNHDVTVSRFGYNCFDRIIPHRNTGKVEYGRAVLEVKGIPDWCPL